VLEAERRRIISHGDQMIELAYLQPQPAYGGQLPDPLSVRELEILRYLPTPLDQREPCSALFISRNTLKTYLRLTYHKAGRTNKPGSDRRNPRARRHDPVMPRIVESDPRVGGRLHIAMIDPEVVVNVTGEYLELDRPNRLRFTWNSDVGGGFAMARTTGLVTRAPSFS
jgi:DNA-binding CsgD family transcriptional regulator